MMYPEREVSVEAVKGGGAAMKVYRRGRGPGKCFGATHFVSGDFSSMRQRSRSRGDTRTKTART